MRTEKKIKERVVGGGPTRRCGHRPSPEKAGIATALYLVNNDVRLEKVLIGPSSFHSSH
jgi:hypothetical protein